MLILLVLFLISVGVYYIWRRQTYWLRRNVAGPRPVPFCGNMLSYLQQKQHYGEVYHDIYKSYPDAPYVGVFKVMDQPAVLLRDVDLIKDVLTTSFHCFKDNDFVVDDKIDPLISQNPFAAREQNWKVARSNMAPLFTPMKIKNMFPIIQPICKQLTDFIDEHHTNVEAAKLCSRYTLEVVVSCGLGVQAQSFANEQSPFITMTENIYSHGSLLKTTAVLFLPIISKILRLSYIPKEVDTWMRSMVAGIMKMPKSDSDQRPASHLQSLIEMRNKKSDITDNMLTGYCLSMILEGFETSSGLMSYCLFELASNPDIQRTAQKEIDRVFRQHNGQITDDLVQELHYLEGVCYETMRLYAPMLVLTKVCNQRYELPPQYPQTSQTRVVVEPGTVVVIPVHSIHRDPLHYENPEQFDPYRFIGDNKNQHNKFAYLSFGEGHRLCIGMKFAFAQSIAGLAAILASYDVEFSSKQTLPLTTAKTSFLLSCANGIWLNFTKRNNK